MWFTMNHQSIICYTSFFYCCNLRALPNYLYISDCHIFLECLANAVYSFQHFFVVSTIGVAQGGKGGEGGGATGAKAPPLLF